MPSACRTSEDLCCCFVIRKLLKPGQNKKGQKFFQLHCFLNTFLLLAAEKKYSKNNAARKCFGPSYFDSTLGHVLWLYLTYKTPHHCPNVYTVLAALHHDLIWSSRPSDFVSFCYAWLIVCGEKIIDWGLLCGDDMFWFQ